MRVATGFRGHDLKFVETQFDERFPVYTGFAMCWVYLSYFPCFANARKEQFCPATST